MLEQGKFLGEGLVSFGQFGYVDGKFDENEENGQ